MPNVTKDELIRRLRSFEQAVKNNADRIPYEIVTNIRRFIVQTRTIDKGKLLFAFDYSESPFTNGVKFIIDTSSDPDRFGIEGFTDQPRKAYGLAGRYYIKQGIEASNFERIFDEMASDAFGL